MKQISFSAYCTPQPQGSMRGFVLPGKNGQKPRAIITSNNTKLKPFRSEVTRSAMVEMAKRGIEEPFAPKHVPIQLIITLSFNRPPSIPKKRKEMVVKPDADKILRACLDAMTGVIYQDDAQVIDVRVTKQYGVEGVFIVATILEESQSLPSPSQLPLLHELPG